MEMHDLCAIAARETRCVLATAIKVEGHVYRKQGVSMLLTEDGKMVGSISPGCLESDLYAEMPVCSFRDGTSHIQQSSGAETDEPQNS